MYKLRYVFDQHIRNSDPKGLRYSLLGLVIGMSLLLLLSSGTRMLEASGLANPSPLRSLPPGEPSPTLLVAKTLRPASPNYINFTDLYAFAPPYSEVEYLVDRNVVSGYSDPSQCPTGSPCFLPNNPITRGAIAKIIKLSEGLASYNPYPNYTFTDVPTDNTFYVYVEAVNYYGIATGYPCGTNPAEPCDSLNRPYFRYGDNASRGQFAKMIVKSSHEMRANISPPTNTYQDADPSSPFYSYIETVAGYAVMFGHPCGKYNNEPCVPPANRSYFGAGTSITRWDVSTAAVLDTALSIDFGHNTPYPGSMDYHCNVTSPTSPPCPDPSTSCQNGGSAFLPGALVGYSIDYNRYTNYLIMGREISFDSNTKDFLECQNGSSIPFAITFHAQSQGGRSCTQGNYDRSSFVTNLPGPITTEVKGACLGDITSEVRIKSMGAINLLTDSAGYFAQADWLSQVGSNYQGQLNIDNYLLSSPIHRDFMQKLCYAAGAIPPNGSTYGVFPCPAPVMEPPQ